MSTRTSFAQRARSVFFVTHLWLGLTLGAWFVLLGVTGSVLAWREELSAAEIRRRFPVQRPSEDAAMISLAQATEAIRIAYPDLDLGQIAAVTVPGARASAYGFTLGRDRRRARTILVDPYRGQILGTAQPRSGMVATIQQLHTRLLGGIRSYVVNGLLTAIAVPLLLSGLWLWWPKTVSQMRVRLTLKRGAPLRRQMMDWHNMAGAYLYVVLFATTLTGALIVGNHVARDGLAQTWQELKTGGPPQGGPGGPGREGGRMQRGEGQGQRGEQAARAGGPAREGRPGQGGPGGSGADSGPTVAVGKERLSPDALLQIARQAVPGYEITRVQLPQRPDQAFRASYSVTTGFATSRSLFLDPYTGKVLPSPAPDADYNAVVRGLHFGNFAGAPMKLIYTVTGLMPLGLFVTGLVMWWKRLASQRAARARRALRTGYAAESIPVEA